MGATTRRHEALILGCGPAGATAANLLARAGVDVLALDPRPAYRDAVEPERRYGMRLAGHEIRWRVDGDGVEVVSVCLATDAVEVNAKG